MEFFVLVGTVPGTDSTGAMMWMPTALEHEARADIIIGLKKVIHEMENPAICGTCRQLMSHPFCPSCATAE